MAVLVFLPFGRASVAAGQDTEFQECVHCPIMEGIPAGKFLMGSPHSEVGRFDSEGPQHVVSIKAFALSKYDITTAQFVRFLKATGFVQRPAIAS